MGFYSWNCKRCDHPLLSVYALDQDMRNAWMNFSVAIFSDNTMAFGEYDGYGRLNDSETITDMNEKYGWDDKDRMINSPLCYHHDCWELEGKPDKYDGVGSSNADDQGWFFEPGTHSIECPIKEEDKE